MKKTMMLLFYAVCKTTLFSAPIEFSSSATFNIPVDDDKKMVRNISSIKYNYGLRLNFKDTTLTGNTRLPSTKFQDLYECTGNDIIKLQDYTFGISHKENVGKINTEVFAGNLKFSSGISRLKTPYFTCPSPQQNPSTVIPGISPSLPSASSTTENLSMAATISPNEQKIFFPCIQIALLDSGEKYGAIYKRFSTSLIPDLMVSFTAGSFFHEYQKESGWFQDERYYMESDYHSGEFILAMLWKTFKTTTSIGIYENPFGGSSRWIRNQSLLNAKFFSMGIYYFDSDEDIITSSGKMPKISRQIFLSPCISAKTGKGITTFRAVLGESFRKSKKRNHINFSQYDFKTGVSFRKMNFNLNGNYNYEYSTETRKDKNSYGLSAGLSLGKIKSTTDYIISCSEEHNKTYSISEKVSFKNIPVENLGISWHLTEGKEKDNWNMDASAGFSKKTKHVKFSGKLNFNFRKAY